MLSSSGAGGLVTFQVLLLLSLAVVVVEVVAVVVVVVVVAVVVVVFVASIRSSFQTPFQITPRGAFAPLR